MEHNHGSCCSTKGSHKKASHGHTTQVKDPVCGMTVDPDNAAAQHQHLGVP